ncbi:MAG: hypothetical protein ACNI28_12630 [Arcobacter sp.]|uniref:hypothetical protein n=1 Tax=Arcobacter sp. TaxID=1872629 RepID=UPI003AFF9F3C
MLDKIDKEMFEFTSGVKTVEGYDKLLDYMNSSIYSSIKLLIFASRTFSIYGRVLLFFVMSFMGLVAISSIGAVALNTMYLLVITLFLFTLLLVYVMYFKKKFILYIEKSKYNKKNTK